jgi:hypothetical protein
VAADQGGTTGQCQRLGHTMSTTTTTTTTTKKPSKYIIFFLIKKKQIRNRETKTPVAAGETALYERRVFTAAQK